MNDPDVPGLPEGIRSRQIDNGNGLAMHVLEAGFQKEGAPCIVLLHGFPELAYSWRKVMLPLAEAGFHVVAPDQRGYGQTGGWDGDYDGDLSQFRLLNLVQDVVGLVFALGVRSVAGVVGHDFGSLVAAWCALVRPDVFRSVALVSSPFGGGPAFTYRQTVPPQKTAPNLTSIHSDLAALAPPRKHYQLYFCGRDANSNMLDCEQGIHKFLRAYYHHKSGDWSGNNPHALAAASAEELAKMPTYYIMEKDQGMAETSAAVMPGPEEIAGCQWLPDSELSVYSESFEKTGFQGGLQWYRAAAHRPYQRELLLFSGRTIDVPSCFIAGDRDWGVYQAPGVFERMQRETCTRMLGCHLIEGAGHWVQQERPEAVVEKLLGFLDKARKV